MAKLKIKGKDIRKIGFPENRIIGMAIDAINRHFKHEKKEIVLALFEKLKNRPEDFLEDEALGNIAHLLMPAEEKKTFEIAIADEPMDFNIFGREHINDSAILQMKNAMRLPVTEAGALMPDAHHGYGLPIGGVLATRDAIIPYAVGVDIGCRMKLSIYDIPESYLKRHSYKLKTVLTEWTCFGMGKDLGVLQDHDVLDRKEFDEIPFLKNLQRKAQKQLGSSGSGNHFVEFGIAEMNFDNKLNVPEGRYLAILSHSGSRGLGATIANHYTKLAQEHCPLPREVKNLAWLDLNKEEGQEYWLAMNLAGDYASACHDRIHINLAKALGIKPIAKVENHHNFAWKEIHNGEELMVHRKGATPAGKDVLGIIPGSMTAPGFIVSGKGEPASLNSASHGAGRLLSRTKAKQSITNSALKKMLKSEGIELIGGGLDEAPIAYKDIHQVMKSQKQLVNVEGAFFPKIVRMDRAK
ncbi:MAG: RtcB family protein [Saprospiraceae bacterium]